MGVKVCVEFGGRLLQRKKAAEVEEEQMPRGGKFIREPDSMVLQAASSRQEIHCSTVCTTNWAFYVWRSGGCKEVPKHLPGLLPGSFAKGQEFAPLRVESSVSTLGTLRGLYFIWQFLQDAYTSISLEIREVTYSSFPNLLSTYGSNTKAAAEHGFMKDFASRTI